MFAPALEETHKRLAALEALSARLDDEAHSEALMQATKTGNIKSRSDVAHKTTLARCAFLEDYTSSWASGIESLDEPLAALPVSGNAEEEAAECVPLSGGASPVQRYQELLLAEYRALLSVLELLQNRWGHYQLYGENVLFYSPQDSAIYQALAADVRISMESLRVEFPLETDDPTQSPRLRDLRTLCQGR
jgi:hypothetical protein